jgi:hypothetical protein
MIQIKKEEAFEKYLSNDQRQIKALGFIKKMFKT